MNQFEKYGLVWKILTSLKKLIETGSKKFELEVNINRNIYIY